MNPEQIISGIKQMLVTAEAITPKNAEALDGVLNNQVLESIIQYKYGEMGYLVKDIHGDPIREGEKFKFNLMTKLDETIGLTGSFSYNDEDLRWEIDVWDDPDYTCLSYQSNGIMFRFEKLPK